MDLKSKKVFLTGATGFVGASLVRKLLEAAADIVILIRKDSNTWRIAEILPELRVFRGDILDKLTLTRIFKETRPDVVFHLAAFGAYSFQNNSDDIFSTNCIGLMNLLQAANETGYDAFINTGSSSEYGIKDRPMAESDMLEPVNMYGVSKASATLFCQALARSRDLPIVTLRLFSVYGPYEEGGRLIPSVILSCLDHKDINATPGEQKRDFVFVDDVVEGYLEAACVKTKPGEILNIGSGQELTVKEVIRKILELTGDGVRVNWGAVPYRKGEMWKWQADISRTASVLGWRSQVCLEEGLRKTVEWFRGHRTLYQKTESERHHASYV